MSLLRGLLRRAEPVDWPSLRVGDAARGPGGRDATVSALAVLSIASPEDDPDDVSTMTIVWLEHARGTEIVVVQRDEYGGDEPLTTEVLADAEPAPLEPWRAVAARLDEPSFEAHVEGAGDVGAEVCSHTCEHGEGLAAAPVPATGWAVQAFGVRRGRVDTRRPWLVLYDGRREPRLCLRLRTR